MKIRFDVESALKSSKDDNHVFEHFKETSKDHAEEVPISFLSTERSSPKE